MPDLQDTLFEEFQQIQGAIFDSSEAWSGGGSGGGQHDTAPRGNVDSLGDQTGAIDVGSSSKSSGSSSSGGIMSDLGGVLASGLGIVPLGLELASIFGGGSSAAPPPLTRYAMPDSIGFMGSTDDSGTGGGGDFGQTGQPRSYGMSTAQTAAPSAPSAPSSSGRGGQSQPIQITVQAMDAQSFMDRSNDIASAVQKAMSNLHPIVDTISNL